MFQDNIPTRLKALRDAAGLSIRALAEKLDMSSSGYAHYETSARFKDAFLPMQMARDIARALAPYGVEPEEVMALAGTADQPRFSEPETKFGFSEDAAHPWSPQPGVREVMNSAIRALAPRALNPGTFKVSRNIPELGLLKGDVIVVDRKRLPQKGELALANAQTDGGHMITVIGRYLPPLLFTAESLTKGEVLDVTSGAVAVYHPIVASFRVDVTKED